MTVRLLGRGALVGLGLAVIAAGIEWRIIPARPYGLLTLAIGGAAGGILLLLALAMSVASLFLARRDQAAALRKRLLAAAIFSGAAGLAGGLGAMLIWVAAGRPTIP